MFSVPKINTKVLRGRKYFKEVAIIWQHSLSRWSLNTWSIQFRYIFLKRNVNKKYNFIDFIFYLKLFHFVLSTNIRLFINNVTLLEGGVS